MHHILVVQSSVDSLAAAQRLASGLLDAKLAACVQISASGCSLYSWQGEREQSEEYYLQIKTTEAACPAVRAWLQRHHPYELPEIILHTWQASADYAAWVEAGVQLA